MLGELLGGFAVGSREATNRDELQQFLASDRVIIIAVDERTADYYATIYRGLRTRGRPIPTNDMWSAVAALQHGYALFSLDGNGRSIDGLIVGATVEELGLP